MRTLDALVFYFPYHAAGGVSMLFLRLSAYFSRQCRVFVADYSDGYMARYLPEAVTLIPIDRSPVFPKSAVFVFQSFLPWRFPFLERVDPEARLLFWNLHPKNFNPELFNTEHDRAALVWIARMLDPLSTPRRRKTHSIVSYLLERDALLFMDRENVRTTSALAEVPIPEPRFLPVVVPRAEARDGVEHSATSAPLRCAWLGRIADFKWHILQHLLERLARATTSVGPIHLSVIGDGAFKDRMRLFAESQKHKDFSIDFVPEMTPEGLALHLRTAVDVLFAMGTSALEGARLGVPVFLVDYSYAPIAGKYRFRWLFERDDECLGEQIAGRHLEEVSTLEQSLRGLQADYRQHSERCRRSFEERFSLEALAPTFLTSCCATRATFGEMASLGFFESDRIGKALRSAAWKMRGYDSTAVVGFRNDC